MAKYIQPTEAEIRAQMISNRHQQITSRKLREAHANYMPRAENLTDPAKAKNLYDAYTRAVQQIQRVHPDSFSEIQRGNTIANSGLYDIAQTNMDDWAQDPISRKAIDGIEYRANIPFGFQYKDFELPITSGGGLARGVTFPSNNQTGGYKVHIGGAYRDWGTPEGGYEALLRHEGDHSVGPLDQTEGEVRKRDMAYGQKNELDWLKDASRGYSGDKDYRYIFDPGTIKRYGK